MEGEADQVHRLIHYPPKHSVSAMVNSLKGVSRRLLRSARPDLAHQYGKGVILVTFLLGCNLSRSANQHPQAVHRISEDTDLTESLISPPYCKRARFYATSANHVGSQALVDFGDAVATKDREKGARPRWGGCMTRDYPR